MMHMTELEYVLAHFEEHFAPFQNKRILIHGSREYAAAIIRRFADRYHFIGLASAEDVEGDCFCGLPVLRGDLFAASPELILLTERVRYAEAVYQQLCWPCLEHGVPIMNMYGLDEWKSHQAALDYRIYNRISPEKWLARLADYDVVGFETVDTLTQREGNKLRVRPLFRKIIPCLQQLGIRIIFSLRRSCPEEEQLEALEEFRSPYGLCFLSDHMPETQDGLPALLLRRTGEDLGFRSWTEHFPGKRGLYVGNGLIYETLLPQCYGLEVMRFMEQYDCLAPAPREGRTPAWQTAVDLAAARAAIDSASLVSFDIFDTLLVRMTLRPEDVFELTKMRLEDLGLPAEDYVQRRMAVQRDFPHGTLQQFYQLLQPMMSWGEEQARLAMETELQTEKNLLSVRAEGAALYHEAKAKKKTVVLVSDMYMPSAVLKDLLEEQGICGWDELLVSCEQGMTKREGLFALARLHCREDETALHFGDDPTADGCCSDHGFRYYPLPSPMRQAEDAGCSSCLSAAQTLADRCLLAQVVQRCFSGEEISAEKRYAACVISPILLGYTLWLARQLAGSAYRKLLLFARDGWLIRPVYEALRSAGLPLPPACYFYTSRRAAFCLLADDPGMIDQVARQAAGANLKGKEILQQVFGLEADACLPPKRGETAEHYLLRHRDTLARLAHDSREACGRYLDVSGIEPDALYAVADFIASGTTQYCLQKAMGLRAHGFYAGNYKADTAGDCMIRFYFPEDADLLYHNYIELEGFFTSPEPSLDGFASDGRLQFAPEQRSAEELARLQETQDEALRLTEAYCRAMGPKLWEITPQLLLALYETAPERPMTGRAYNDLLKEPILQKKAMAAEKETGSDEGFN